MYFMIKQHLPTVFFSCLFFCYLYFLFISFQSYWKFSFSSNFFLYILWCCSSWVSTIMCFVVVLFERFTKCLKCLSVNRIFCFVQWEVSCFFFLFDDLNSIWNMANHYYKVKHQWMGTLRQSTRDSWTQFQKLVVANF